MSAAGFSYNVTVKAIVKNSTTDTNQTVFQRSFIMTVDNTCYCSNNFPQITHQAQDIAIVGIIKINLHINSHQALPSLQLSNQVGKINCIQVLPLKFKYSIDQDKFQFQNYFSLKKEILIYTNQKLELPIFISDEIKENFYLNYTKNVKIGNALGFVLDLYQGSNSENQTSNISEMNQDGFIQSDLLFLKLKNLKTSRSISVQLTKISFNGLVTVQFNDSLLMPKNQSIIEIEKALKFRVRNGQDSQVNEERQNRSDTLEIEFAKNYFFVNQKLNAMVIKDQKLQKKLSPQSYNSSKDTFKLILISRNDNARKYCIQCIKYSYGCNICKSISADIYEIFNEITMENDGYIAINSQLTIIWNQSSSECDSMYKGSNRHFNLTNY
ncbi:UNKNOWN [Stylonychia lemnae]|uniref:Uncharacterized protein n=1 Tax=Stylonychia lemnae TaxID=5949 RepID=A0A078AFY0_STYLE|nr:UNKNOWN [Stylonychia lemnae]|eukprot:CDW80756.1 UNKNOWN [Stylonychia lemnae]